MGDVDTTVAVESGGSEGGAVDSTSVQDDRSSTDESSASEDSATETATGIKIPQWMRDLKAGKETGKQETDTGKEATGGKESATPWPSAEDQKSGQEDAGKKNGDGQEPGQDGEKSKEIENNMNVALRESRAETKFFKGRLSEAESQIAELQAQLAAKPQAEVKPAGNKWESFKELSDDELEALADDDPAAPAKYAKELIAYERYKSEQEALNTQNAQRETEWGVQREVALSRIKEALPDSAAHDALAKSLSDHGFTEELYAFTDPNTKIITSDGEQVPLNQLAARLVESLVSLTGAAGKAPEITIDNVPASVRDAIIAAEHDKILNKVKNSAGNRPKTVSQIPSASRTEQGKSRFEGKTYAQLKAEGVSDADLAAYLRGE